MCELGFLGLEKVPGNDPADLGAISSASQKRCTCAISLSIYVMCGIYRTPSPSLPVVAALSLLHRHSASGQARATVWPHPNVGAEGGGCPTGSQETVCETRTSNRLSCFLLACETVNFSPREPICSTSNGRLKLLRRLSRLSAVFSCTIILLYRCCRTITRRERGW